MDIDDLQRVPLFLADACEDDALSGIDHTTKELPRQLLLHFSPNMHASTHCRLPVRAEAAASE